MSAIDNWWQVVLAVTAELARANVAYCLVDEAALVAQGVELPLLPPVTVSVQWDAFPGIHSRFRPLGAGPVTDRASQADFAFNYDTVAVTMVCFRNSVIAADPYRIVVERDERQVWVKSLYFYLREWPADDPRRRFITAMLRSLQRQITEANGAAWNQQTYDAWVDRHGPPVEVAARIREQPTARLAAIAQPLGNVQGRKVINLLGSHGIKAVAMAVLGADVTVVDIAPENARYAAHLAAAAGIGVRYVVSDVLALSEAELSGDYDIVLMELGILHYFVDLRPLVTVVHRLLRPGGKLILQDFHPISTKLITSKGRKHKVTGNYFDPTLHETDVAYLKHLSSNGGDANIRVLQRYWTLGEVVSAFAVTGLCLRELVEEPNTKLDDVGLPKTFTLVVEKLQQVAEQG